MVSIGSAQSPQVHPAVARARTVPALLDALQTSGPGPRLTWYAADGDRVELSGRVLANWVAKTANLLREEFDIDAGELVRVQLPGHWRRVVIDLAVSALGARPSPDGDLLITDRPVPGTDQMIAVAPGALVRSFDGPLHGALDYNAEVTGQDDVFLPQEPQALPDRPDLPPGARVLLTEGSPDLTARAIAVWRADGSVLLVASGVAPERLTAERAVEWSALTG